MSIKIKCKHWNCPDALTMHSRCVFMKRDPESILKVSAMLSRRRADVLAKLQDVLPMHSRCDKMYMVRLLYNGLLKSLTIV